MSALFFATVAVAMRPGMGHADDPMSTSGITASIFDSFPDTPNYFKHEFHVCDNFSTTKHKVRVGDMSVRETGVIDMSAHLTFPQCKKACDQDAHCVAFVVTHVNRLSDFFPNENKMLCYTCGADRTKPYIPEKQAKETAYFYTHYMKESERGLLGSPMTSGPVTGPMTGPMTSGRKFCQCQSKTPGHSSMCEGHRLGIDDCLRKVLKGSTGPGGQICQWGDMVDIDCTKEHDEWMMKHGATIGMPIGMPKPDPCKCKAIVPAYVGNCEGKGVDIDYCLRLVLKDTVHHKEVQICQWGDDHFAEPVCKRQHDDWMMTHGTTLPGTGVITNPGMVTGPTCMCKAKGPMYMAACEGQGFGIDSCLNLMDASATRMCSWGPLATTQCMIEMVDWAKEKIVNGVGSTHDLTILDTMVNFLTKTTPGVAAGPGGVVTPGVVAGPGGVVTPGTIPSSGLAVALKSMRARDGYDPRVAAPRPPTPGDQCTNNMECPGTGTYCYPSGQYGENICRYSKNGVGSMCRRGKDSDCGVTADGQKMECQGGRRRLDNRGMQAFAPRFAPRPRPDATGKCQLKKKGWWERFLDSIGWN